MSARGRSTRILCISCNMCVNTLRRYPALELNTILSSWVYPQIITEEDYVCEACNLQQEVDSHDAGPSRGHSHVCPLCGCSTLQRRSDKILKDNPSELQRLMIDIIKARVAPQQVTESHCVCHVCWLRIRRVALRLNRLDHARSQPPAAQEVQDHQPIAK